MKLVLDVIDLMDNWESPRLGIRFDMSGEELQLYLPNGEIFQGIEQIKEQLQQKDEQLQQKDEQLQHKNEQLQLLAEKLREMGIDPDEFK
ncbi:MAG: hypothetical protein F6K17_12850 [Okeania sp. SIO3C4]|nr:hypothetical protein [Okeania sp. SIO3B3]NER03434.1 hypothetical protein [Okeania sp. SIO3C4]